jgi:hypothetical protein
MLKPILQFGMLNFLFFVFHDWQLLHPKYTMNINPKGTNPYEVSIPIRLTGKTERQQRVFKETLVRARTHTRYEIWGVHGGEGAAALRSPEKLEEAAIS